MDDILSLAQLFRKASNAPVDYLLKECKCCGTIYHFNAPLEVQDTCPLCLGKNMVETTISQLVENTLILTKFQRTMAVDQLSHFIATQIKAQARIVLVAKVHPDWVLESNHASAE